MDFIGLKNRDININLKTKQILIQTNTSSNYRTKPFKKKILNIQDNVLFQLMFGSKKHSELLDGFRT